MAYTFVDPNTGFSIELLNTEEAAERLGLHKNTVAHHVMMGKLPNRVHRGRLFATYELDAFAEVPRKAGRPRKEDKDEGQSLSSKIDD